MTNLEKYRNAFMEGLGVNGEGMEDLTFGGVTEWDSVGHIELVASLEEAFNIMLETDDIIDLSSYLKGIEILKKYGIEI